MEKIGLLIDSTTLTRDEFSTYDFVKVAQLKVEIGDITYSENELSKADMEKYIEAGTRFLTSQPSPAEFLELYQQYFDEGYTHVMTIVISHRISGTYQSAMIAKSMVDFQIEIDVHSPLVASYGVALGANKIAEMIKSGSSYLEITEKYQQLFAEPLVIFTLGHLKNLARGGRLSKVQALVGNILRIKPIIEMIDGKLELVKKERTNIACIQHFMEKIDYYANKYKKLYLDVVNIHMDEAVNKLVESIKTKYNNLEIHMTNYLSPVFYSHLGNIGFGIGILTE